MALDDYWQRYHAAIGGSLKNLATSTANLQAIEPEAAFALLCQWTHDVRTADGMIHFVGNGASAAMASHMALDWSKNGKVRAVVHNDLASLTAYGNDLGYERVFAASLQRHARRGDLLAAISSSGNSPNIVRAIDAARETGMRVVTFSGLKPDNRSRAAGDLNFFIPAWSYGMVECAHQVLLHAWIDRFMDVREWSMTQTQTFA
jgi:D-sedoheptulose 7-phosphate isomerase